MNGSDEARRKLERAHARVGGAWQEIAAALPDLDTNGQTAARLALDVARGLERRVTGLLKLVRTTVEG